MIIFLIIFGTILFLWLFQVNPGLIIILPTFYLIYYLFKGDSKFNQFNRLEKLTVSILIMIIFIMGLILSLFSCGIIDPRREPPPPASQQEEARDQEGIFESSKDSSLKYREEVGEEDPEIEEVERDKEEMDQEEKEGGLAGFFRRIFRKINLWFRGGDT